uniref:Uncharacterized protein n=1 Tax=Chenopodium quinoa TaxID=63459 RepID=A0A803MWP8_CHEQI
MCGESSSILVHRLSWLYGSSGEEIELQEIVNGLINTQIYNSPGTLIALMFITLGIGFNLSPAPKDFVNPAHKLIPDLHDNVAFRALLFGLKSNKLKFELVHDKVSTFSEAMERAERIIEASEHKAILPKPNPMNTPIEQKNKKLWCEYHKECGHTTRNCRELKRALDKLAEEGKLYRYLKSPSKDKQSKAAKDLQEAHSSADINLSINVIAGGFASGGLSNRARKSHLRSLEEPIYDIGTPSSAPKDPLMFEGRKCYVDSLKSPENSVNQEDKGAKRKAMEIDEPQHPVMRIYMAENPKQYGRPRPIEEDENIPLGDDPARTVRSYKYEAQSKKRASKCSEEHARTGRWGARSG